MTAAAASPRSGPWGRLVALLSREEAGTSFALFRIGIGLCLVLTLVEMCVRGVAPVLWLADDFGGYQASPRVSALLAVLGGATPLGVWLLVGGGIAAGAALTLGVGGPVLGRAIAFLALHCFQGCVYANPDGTGAYDGLLSNALWLLVLGNGTATLSLHARLRRGAWTTGEPVLAFARWLAIYQLVLMYWMTGLQKVSVHWTPGGDFGALYYILQQPSWNRGDMSWVAPFFPLTQLATAMVWVWEISAPLLLLSVFFHATRDRPGRLRTLANRMRLRSLYLAMGIAFHLTTALLMNVGPFSWVALSYYFCLLEPREWDGLLARLGPRRPTHTSALQAGLHPRSGGDADTSACPSRAIGPGPTIVGRGTQPGSAHLAGPGAKGVHMLRSSFTSTLLGLIGIALFLGIAPGCDGDGGIDDLAARFIAAQDSLQQSTCTCAVAAGEYATQEECLAEEFKTEPLGDEACLAQVILNYPEDLLAIECQIEFAETFASCLVAASCVESAVIACLQTPEPNCPDLTPEGDAAGEACFDLSGPALAAILADSRGDANAAFCACSVDEPACLLAAENYGEVCSAQVVADHADGAALLECEIEEWDFYADCIDDVVACDVDEIGFCGDSRDAFLGFCADDAQQATNDALAACVE